MEPKNINRLLLVALISFMLVNDVKADKSSGASVWWLLFVLIALVIAAGYLFYAVYYEKKPFGRGHVYLDPDAEENRGRGMTNRERASRNYNIDNPGMAGSQASPEMMRAYSLKRTMSMKDNEILKLMTDVKKEEQPMVDGEFQIHLDPYHPEDIEFLQKAKNYKFPNYKMLYIWNIDVFMRNSDRDLIDFLNKTLPREIKYFALHSSDPFEVAPLIKILKSI